MFPRPIISALLATTATRCVEAFDMPIIVRINCEDPDETLACYGDE